MKLATRKIRCPKCERLVPVREQAEASVVKMYCRRCGSLLWTLEEARWHPQSKAE